MDVDDPSRAVGSALTEPAQLATCAAVFLVQLLSKAGPRLTN